MRIFSIKVVVLPMIFAFVLVGTVNAQDSTYVLLRDFEEGWQDAWFQRLLGEKPTNYEVVLEDTNRVLMASSEGTASSLWYPITIRPARRGTITWRWKIKKALSKNTNEKSKLGDDYAARVFVVFEPHILSWKTRALCYVWSANRPVGEQATSPYAKTVKTIVLQSGNDNKGKWITEKRNFIADYIKAFGRKPEMVIAVALMVDTDNSLQSATAWFDDLMLRVPMPASSNTQKTETPSPNSGKPDSLR